MKLLIVTVVDQFKSEVLALFKKAGIESFSGSEIDGYKSLPPLMMTQSWFPGEKGGNESRMFFSFTDADHIDTLFGLMEEFNAHLETNNPIKAVVVPIERSL
ncbi:hypothetical protein OZ410_13560 [Robiginitalea sp. M366]|uniref:hypothetical protein n=1 Tax=Robiginitalea aestuariiviva TaxID=3036903 RepID=UPI00240E0177|nr:hypothetical protein [Robiginitalea aestuariiviva]MDG1573351.1 hypothetical protein [Robiginitalea aestuariiviva]